MGFENLLIEQRDAVSLITINRPDKLNALNGATRRDLIEALNDIRADDSVRVVVITGAGEKSFIAGADITEFENRSPVDQYRVMRGPRVFEAVESFPKPVIAAINGFCLGGGNELAMACDIRIASSNARFGQPEIKLGLLPGGGGTQRLPRLVGMGKAALLLMTGDIIRAPEALTIGLVDEVVEPDQLVDRVMEIATSISTKSPVALQLIKESLAAANRTPLDEGLRLESTLFGMAFSSEDKAEGVAAFLEKRDAEFKGR